jgi:hypothetical protein
LQKNDGKRHIPFHCSLAFQMPATRAAGNSKYVVRQCGCLSSRACTVPESVFTGRSATTRLAAIYGENTVIIKGKNPKFRSILFAIIVVMMGTHLVLVRSAAAITSPQVIRFNDGKYDRASAITADLSGNFYVAGYSERSGTQQTFAVVKHNAQGNTEWVARYNGAAGGIGGSAQAVNVDAAGNVYAAGYVYDGTIVSSKLDYLVVKLNANGAQQWARRYNGIGNNYDQATEVVADASGNVYVSGFSYGQNADWATLKFASDGTQIWERRVSSAGEGSEDRPIDMALTAEGNLVLTGIAQNGSGLSEMDVLTLAYDPSGNTLWQALYTETEVSHEFPADFDIDADGNICITGRFQEVFQPELAEFPFILKYDRNGTLLFANRQVQAGGQSIDTDVFGNIFVTGVSSPASGTGLPAAAKFDGSGNLIWIKSLDAVLPLHILAASDGKVFLSGSISAIGSSGIDYWTAELDAQGNPVSDHRFNGTGDRADQVRDMCFDSAGNLLVTGTSWGGFNSIGGTADDMVTLKFANNGTALPQPPVAPGNLNAQATSASHISLRWRDNSGNENGFRVERCQGAGCTNFEPVGQVGVNITSFTDSGLVRNTTYNYRVRAFNSVGDSAPSDTASARTARK